MSDGSLQTSSNDRSIGHSVIETASGFQSYSVDDDRSTNSRDDESMTGRNNYHLEDDNDDNGYASPEETFNATNSLAKRDSPSELKVRWKDSMSPEPLDVEACSSSISPTTVASDNISSGRKAGLLRKSTYMTCATANDGAVSTMNTGVESSVVGNRMSTQALRKQMIRLEEKIKKAAKMELELLNRSKQIREKRSRMMSIHEKMSRKLKQKTQSSAGAPVSPLGCYDANVGSFTLLPPLYRPTASSASQTNYMQS